MKDPWISGENCPHGKRGWRDEEAYAQCGRVFIGDRKRDSGWTESIGKLIDKKEDWKDQGGYVAICVRLWDIVKKERC